MLMKTVNHSLQKNTMSEAPPLSSHAPVRESEVARQEREYQHRIRLMLQKMDAERFSD
jgi:hypothetical protein